ncbi:(2Fe-2S)-binding protein [Paenibacillus sp. P96]|uniref:(2Fe-2S)-binding protein n=1 Tax=Paenibacillus zeirhizosphaerae TaxID=2987519 RepID=A0ABT9FW70_9BACL|nr:(2Fe-2S)-binding protein [Paenibacillus sp. P96]MDP4098727.1 (2Fe-2S)-binding protein [Paenibacillus sp. P96]
MNEQICIWHAVINGQNIEMQIPPSRRLLDILRVDLNMTGTKISCEVGRCGACMVLLDGEPANACLLMAYQCVGRRITTIEGLSVDAERRYEGHEEPMDDLHPIQQAFVEEGGFQCGYCTPGMIISTKALLDRNPSPSQEEIESALCGNLCRCTGYGGIVRSVQKAAELCRRQAEPSVKS